MPGPPGRPGPPRRIPTEAYDVLGYVLAHGSAPAGHAGGQPYHNRNRQLPAGGSYVEYDVDGTTGIRTARRIVVDTATGRAWYTSDHYRTFRGM